MGQDEIIPSPVVSFTGLLYSQLIDCLFIHLFSQTTQPPLSGGISSQMLVLKT